MSTEIDILLQLIKTNEEASVRRHDETREDIKNLSAKVDGLEETRTLAKGAWKATAAIAGGVSGAVAVIGVIIGWLYKIAVAAAAVR